MGLDEMGIKLKIGTACHYTGKLDVKYMIHSRDH